MGYAPQLLDKNGARSILNPICRKYLCRALSVWNYFLQFGYLFSTQNVYIDICMFVCVCVYTSDMYHIVMLQKPQHKIWHLLIEINAIS